MRAIKRGELDRTPQPAAPLDILAQQIVAACVAAGEEGWREDALFESFRRAWPYRDLKREDFDAVIQMHLNGRHGLLHRDGVGGRIMARKRARITAITGGGAIPDVADYHVRQQPDDTFVGTLNEDFAVEANVGDIFQLGNTSWRILKVERGVVRVADAQGQPPSIPFWLGEGASRTAELSAEIGDVREAVRRCGGAAKRYRLGARSGDADRRIPRRRPPRARHGADAKARRAGTILRRKRRHANGAARPVRRPHQSRLGTGPAQAVLPRVRLRIAGRRQRRGDRHFARAASTASRWPTCSTICIRTPCAKVLTQAVLDQPMFESRWRWNATRSLMLERFQHGKAVPPQILRMRAADLLAASFPAAVACPENLPPGDLAIPMDHPLVRQTIDDCLTEATDIEGLIEVLQGPARWIDRARGGRHDRAVGIRAGF